MRCYARGVFFSWDLLILFFSPCSIYFGFTSDLVSFIDERRLHGVAETLVWSGSCFLVELWYPLAWNSKSILQVYNKTTRRQYVLYCQSDTFIQMICMHKDPWAWDLLFSLRLWRMIILFTVFSDDVRSMLMFNSHWFVIPQPIGIPSSPSGTTWDFSSRPVWFQVFLPLEFDANRGAEERKISIKHETTQTASENKIKHFGFGEKCFSFWHQDARNIIQCFRHVPVL